MSEKPPPNLGAGLLAIHRVLTRGIAVARENGEVYAATGFPDDKTAEGYFRYVLALGSVMHGHHASEDEIAFPFLRDRLPDAPYDELAADHLTIHAVLDDIAAARESGSLADLNAALTRLSELWQPHIQKEEEFFTPAVSAEALSVQENIELSRQSAEHSSEVAQPAPLTLPFILYNLEPEDRALMTESMPPELTQHLVPVVWKDEWAPMKPFLLD
jgi:hypothetical protein